MEKNLEELNALREQTKKEVALKLVSIVKYIEENSLDSLLSTWNRCYNTAYNGMTTEMLIIESNPTEGVDCVSIDLQDIRENKIQEIINCILNINEKPAYEESNGYGTSGYYFPNTQQCRDWINRKLKQISELETMEIDKLKEILSSLN